MNTLGIATLETEVDLKGLDKGLDRAHDNSKKSFGAMGVAIGTLGSHAVMGGINLVVGGIKRLGAEFADATALAKEQRDVELQLENVLKSMGGVVGLTADQIKDMASGLQNVTNFGDEAILSGQNILLTFGNIGGEIFPQVTETMLDMSQALGQDLKSSAIQLGKALNDPIVGVGALSRVGVSFTEQQKEQIRVLQESGDMMGAQAIIMGELEKQFGGSAQALADPAIQAKNAWGDFKEEIGGVILLVQGELARRALPVIQGAIEKVKPIVDGIASAFGAFSEALERGISPTRAIELILPGLLEKFGLGRDVIERVVFWVKELVGFFQGLVANLQSGMGPIDAIVDAFLNWTATAEGMSSQLFNIIIGVLNFKDMVVEFITSFVEWKDVLLGVGIAIGVVLIPIIWSILAPILAVVAAGVAITLAIAAVRKAWESDWMGIRTAVTEAWDNKIKPAIEQLRAWLAVNIPIAMERVKEFWESTLRPTLVAAGDYITGTVVPAITTAYEWLATNIPEAFLLVKQFWNDTLLPALIGARDYILNEVVPAIKTAYEWLSDSLTSAFTDIKTFWENTLRPTFKAIWEFLRDDVIPIIVDVYDIILLVANIAFQAIKQVWEDDLQPALKAIWEWFKDKITPEIEESKRVMTVIRDFMAGPLSSAVSALVSGALDRLKRAFDGIKNALQGLKDWLDRVKSALGGFQVPDIIDPGSPTPFEIGLRGIASALNEVNTGMEKFSSFANSIAGPGAPGIPGGKTGAQFYTAGDIYKDPRLVAMELAQAASMTSPAPAPGTPGGGAVNNWNLTINQASDAVAGNAAGSFALMQAYFGGA